MAHINKYDSDSSTLDSEDESEQEARISDASNTDSEQDQDGQDHIMKDGSSSEDEQEDEGDSVDDDDNDIDDDEDDDNDDIDDEDNSIDNEDDDNDDNEEEEEEELETSPDSNKIHAKSVIREKNNHNSNTSVQELNLDDEILEDDEEIRAFLASGKIKPGCTYKADENIVKEFPNCVSELKQKLKEIKYKGAWLERMDITGEAAPMAPEMQMQIREEKKKLTADREVNLQNPFQDMSVLKDDFEREVMFQRHAQAAVLLAIPRLQALGVLTHRPEDFFGQMVKTDEHMQKVRTKLQEKLLTRQASEHNKKLNKLRKFGKKVQTEVMLSKAEKKREMMKKIKQYRQGQISHLDFLNDDIGGDDGVGEHGGLFSGGKKKRDSINKDRSNSRQALTDMLGDGENRPGRGGGSFRGRGGMSRGGSGDRGGSSFRGRGVGGFRGRGGGGFRGRGGGGLRGRGGGGFRGRGGGGFRGGDGDGGSGFRGRGGGGFRGRGGGGFRGRGSGGFRGRGGGGDGDGGGGFRGRGGGGGRGGQKFRGGAKQRHGKDRRKSSNN